MAHINMISTVIPKSQSQFDSWVVPKPADYQKYGDTIPLNEIKVAYQSIQCIDKIVDGEEESSFDPLHEIFSTNEDIMETMALGYSFWDGDDGFG